MKNERIETSQITNTVVMVRPNYFGYNPETALNNGFMHIPSSPEGIVREAVWKEFDQMVEKLEKHDLRVVTIDSPLGPEGEITPDAVFPNNWFSTHPNTLVLYPMRAQTRRWERQPENLKKALMGINILYPETIDLTKDENDGLILEGTGSLVLDRINRIAYAIESQRTSQEELNKWAKLMDYKPHFFHAVDFEDAPIYHTNVIMSVGDNFAVVCSEAIKSSDEKEKLARSLIGNGKTVVNITMHQMYNMCGNVLQTKNTKEEKLIIMSERAKNAFGPDNLKILERSGTIVPVKIDTIEAVGGGSARCMVAEVFYKK